MRDYAALLANLQRPRLLIRAARFGLVDYRRERDLRRLLHAEMPPQQAMARLLDLEEMMEAMRQAGDAAYTVSRHVDVLIALLGEARLLPRPEPVVTPATSAAAEPVPFRRAAAAGS